MGLTDDTNKVSTNMEELPYFAEKYPGKVCCLCNLCERSSLGQGDLLKIPINIELMKSAFAALNDPLKTAGKETEATENNERKKGLLKSKITINNELINELDNVGYDDTPTMEGLLSGGTVVYVHSMCAMWSLGLHRINEEFVPNIEEMVVKSLARLCTFCLRYGASIGCRMSCKKNFHLPCAAAAGCFLIIENFSIFCVEHINQVPYISINTNIECRQCCSLGDISKLIMCCTCGAHYHTNCVGLANFPDSRSGWNCQQCCKCLICRQSENAEGRFVKCEQCQKLYHTTCLRPIISSIPKYGWKCNRCRICSDCGSRTPGAGASSRWHCHYTICDSCYQQRNKGFSCPICHKAYRAASHKEMVKCSSCNKFVHSSCDDEADLTVYHMKKESNPDYDYVCPPCKMLAINEKHMNGTDIGSDSVVLSSESLSKEIDSDFFEKDTIEFSNSDSLKLSKKRMGVKEFSRGGKIGKIVVGKAGLMAQLNRKRSVRGKSRQLMMMSTASSTSDYASNHCSEEDLSLEKKIVLCSAKDKFILSQDICVMCGSLGTNQEACLIACVQCGQCYHPHCANVNVSKTMLQKGWRCLDCTVCEGCGQKNDEARLILCDECDISYHIYCMSPPLDAVPNGNWKCKWCAICQKCGRNSPGKNSSWWNGFLECGPCASQATCFVCMQQYNDNELIIQCSNCERWLHCICDSIKNEEEAELFTNIEYHCLMCRSKNNSTKGLATKILLSDTLALKSCGKATSSEVGKIAAQESGSQQPTNDVFEPTDTTYRIDGVCVSEHGFNMIRSLTTEIKRKRKLRTDTNSKESGIMSAIETVIAGNSTTNSVDVGSDGNAPNAQNDKNVVQNYKDGMVWLGQDGSQPEGFSLSTNEEGINILRKKRQRNLQKLGIGGFNVRMRGFRKDNDEHYVGSLESSQQDSEKKKKIIRKKVKSKLSESYPPYLQEAFFGKSLLDNKQPQISFDESESSDNGAFSSIADFTHDNSGQQSQKATGEKKEDKVELKLNTDMTNVACAVKTEKLDVPGQGNVTVSGGKPLNTDCRGTISNLKTSSNMTVTLEKQISGDFNPQSACNTNINAINNNQSNFPIVDNKMMHKTVTEKVQQLQSKDPAFTQNNMALSETLQIRNVRERLPYAYSQVATIQNKVQPTYSGQKFEDGVAHIEVERNLILSQQQPQSNEKHVADNEMQIQVEEGKETSVAGTQKTAEKMRRDEDLGEMATISAVLYANTQHPELKHMYPNWNERCKQILKKWRSLSTEMKAPFLQHAKDNRSVLRIRRSQQEPEKMYFQQKTLKEQEQERAWKQHQAKSKETYTNKFSKTAFITDFTRVECSNAVNSRQPQIYDINLLPDNTQNTKQLQLNRSKHLSERPPHTLEHVNLAPDTNKQLSQLEDNPQFVSSLMQVQENNESFDKNIEKKQESQTLHNISERNDIFIGGEKCWAGSAKLPDTKDAVASNVEKLEPDENAGLGDILGGLGEGDDDDILKSLTAEIGDDFNILEYADPELDELNASQNLLNKLDFDENQKNI